MNTKQVELIVVQTELIFNEAKEMKGRRPLIRSNGAVDYLYYIKNINLLISQFNILATKVNFFIKNEGLDETINEITEIKAKLEDIKVKRIVFNTDEKLLRLIFGTSKILTFIRQGAILPEVTLNKLDSLTKELDDMKKEIDSDIYENLKYATDSFEKGCFLGSSLISGRVLKASFDQISGKDINEKIDELKKYDLVRDKDGKDSLIKANHFGRNLTSHELKIMPSSSEAISYLGDAIKVAKLTSEYKSKILDKNSNTNDQLTDGD